MGMQRFATKLASPFGLIVLLADAQQRLTHLYFVKDQAPGAALALVEKIDRAAVWSSGHFAEPIRQLSEYFDRARREFDLSLAAEGNAFQHRVWDSLRAIPYGQLQSYGEIARRLGLENGARAVGRANATNPISIIVPCHRVVGSTGKLTGYAGGIAVKDALLVHEGAREASLF